MSKQYALRKGDFIFSVIYKGDDFGDIDFLLLTEFKTGRQIIINESDIDLIFRNLSLLKEVS